MDAMITIKAPRLKLVKMDIFKENVLSLTVIADEILSKPIEVIISNCFIYVPKVIKLFFKPFLPLFIKPY